MALDTDGSAGIDHLCGLPIGIVEARLFPAPRIARAVDALHGSGHVVLILQPLIDILPVERRVSGIAERFPSGAGVHRLLTLGVPLEQEAGAMRDLRHGPVLSAVPDHGGEHVSSRLQIGAEVNGVEAPVAQIALRRTGGNRLAVHEKAITIVGRNVNHEMAGRVRQVEALAEVVDAIIEGRRPRRRNPLRRPARGQQARVHGGLRQSRRNQQHRQPQQSFHCTPPFRTAS